MTFQEARFIRNQFWLDFKLEVEMEGQYRDDHDEDSDRQIEVEQVHAGGFFLAVELQVVVDHDYDETRN